jgi:hypothetical protein
MFVDQVGHLAHLHARDRASSCRNFASAQAIHAQNHFMFGPDWDASAKETVYRGSHARVNNSVRERLHKLHGLGQLANIGAAPISLDAVL